MRAGGDSVVHPCGFLDVLVDLGQPATVSIAGLVVEGREPGRGSVGNHPTPVTRSFDRLSGAAAENGESRILVGFHFRHAVTDGLVHGQQIGRWAVRNFMQPVDE